jgi:DNA-binding MarR family transcriptional regulator
MPDPDDRESDEAKVVRAVLRLARALRQAATDSEVSGGALGLLATLYRRGSMSAVDLARRERLQPQSLSRHLARLDKDGFIERTTDAGDHRRKLIALTPQGLAALGRAMNVRRRRLAEMMAERLNARERATLLCAATSMLRMAE